MNFFAQVGTAAEIGVELMTTVGGVFTIVGALTVTMIGFYMIVNIVRGIAKPDLSDGNSTRNNKW
jgi:hypothetical protein